VRKNIGSSAPVSWTQTRRNMMSEPFTYRLKMENIRVYDGDTIKVKMLELGMEVNLANQSIRMEGINTPEIRGSAPYEKNLAYQARDYLHNILEAAEVISFTSRKRGKFGRLIGRVYADGQDVNEMMIDAGFARPYDGTGTRQPWVPN
tara:strand:+ start:2379 stop:2822 length:444 start_codon:yes stop_codon:yes gene_type:complete